MGLDGFSLNNLMLNKGNTSKENAILADALANSRGVFSRSIEQLEKKQEVDAEDKQNTSYSGGSTDSDDEEEEEGEEGENEDDAEEENSEEAGQKYLDYNEEENQDTPTAENTMEKINPQELSKLVIDLQEVGGMFIDKKI